MNSLGILKKALTEGSYTQVSRAAALVLLNGATIWFRSAENIASLYSDSVSAAVIDNATQIPEKAWLALRETLANTRAPVRIISTVAGRDNWFNEMARRVETEPEPELNYAKFSALDAIEEGIMSSADLEYARATLPDHIFRAMYLCEPYDDRVEAAHRAADPRMMTDEELAIIAGLDPSVISSISDETLETIARS